MGGGNRVLDDVPLERSDETDAFTPSSKRASSEIDSETPPISSSEASRSNEAVRQCRTFFDLLHSYERPSVRVDTLQKAKDDIRWHKPGDWIEEVGGLTASDYEVPETTTLLLVGPRGSGKSTIVNRITKVFEGDLFADRAQVSHNLSVTKGSCFLQEYMIPRLSKSLCIYDTRSLSPIPDDNLELLERWMTQGVSHGEMVIRVSDDLTEKNRMKAMARQGCFCPCQKRMVNFVIFVVDGISVLKALDSKDATYNEMLVETFNYPFLSFKDNKPVVVVTHGDELLIHDRARVRTHLGDILGIPPSKQIFDIPDTSDCSTELAIVDMLRYCIEHADRNLPYKQSIQLVDRDLPYNLSNLLEGRRFLETMMDKFQHNDSWFIIEVFIICLYVMLLLKYMGYSMK